MLLQPVKTLMLIKAIIAGGICIEIDGVRTIVLQIVHQPDKKRFSDAASPVILIHSKQRQHAVKLALMFLGKGVINLVQVSIAIKALPVSSPMNPHCTGIPCRAGKRFKVKHKLIIPFGVTHNNAYNFSILFRHAGIRRFRKAAVEILLLKALQYLRSRNIPG